jgi:diphthine-ammonia ligase
MLNESGERSRSHGLSVGLLRDQASALGVRLVTKATSWDDYEANFIDSLLPLRDEGFSAGVFGDIDLEGHREWVARVCSAVGMEAVLPLWRCERRALLREFISSGFEAMIVAVNDSALDQSYLGRALDGDTVEELATLGVDVSGEAGEYHTFVTNGPGFSRPVRLADRGHESHDGYSFLELGIADD